MKLDHREVRRDIRQQIVEMALEDVAEGARPIEADCPFGVKSRAGRLWLRIVRRVRRQRMIKVY